MTLNKEIALIRELAKRVMEIAVSDRHVRMRKRFRDTNDLKIVRPPLNIREIPWHEMNMDKELDLLCEDETLRAMELEMRRNLYMEKHLKCDNYIEPFWVIGKAIHSTGNGFAVREKRVAVDQANRIVSHQYEDILADEKSLEMYHDPVITADPESDRRRVEFAQEVLNGIMPVQLRGRTLGGAPWDRISELRGVEPILIDMYDRPEYLHKIMSLFTRSMACEIDQCSALGLCDTRATVIHATPGDITPPEGVDENDHTSRGTWFRTMAQIFSTVSPDAHYEFDMQYTIPLASKCAYTYYGCCEPLHDRIDKLKLYPNLRKIGCSPWADVEKTAEQIGGDYVLSRKPNPANVAIATDPEVIRREIAETARLCLRYGCPCDITLKDISTVSYKPQNLFIWAETASRVLDEYYGEA